MAKRQFQIYRYDPDKDSKPYMQTVEIELEGNERMLLDALVIRCLIVPAVMRLFGPAAWWLPRRLDRRLPEVALEHA